MSETHLVTAAALGAVALFAAIVIVPDLVIVHSAQWTKCFTVSTGQLQFPHPQTSQSFEAVLDSCLIALQSSLDRHCATHGSTTAVPLFHFKPAPAPTPMTASLSTPAAGPYLSDLIVYQIESTASATTIKSSDHPPNPNNCHTPCASNTDSHILKHRLSHSHTPTSKTYSPSPAVPK